MKGSRWGLMTEVRAYVNTRVAHLYTSMFASNALMSVPRRRLSVYNPCSNTRNGKYRASNKIESAWKMRRRKRLGGARTYTMYQQQNAFAESRTSGFHWWRKSINSKLDGNYESGMKRAQIDELWMHLCNHSFQLINWNYLLPCCCFAEEISMQAFMRWLYKNCKKKKDSFFA